MPEAAATGDGGRKCPQCGASAERDQLFCLECGERLGLGYRRPPSWRVPTAIVVAVALAAGAGLAFALAEVSDDAERVASASGPATAPASTLPPVGQTAPGAPAPPAGQTTPSVPPPTTGETETAPSETTTQEETTEEETPEEETPAPGDGGGEIREWPDHTSAYTVILQSTDNRAGARDTARRASEAGVPAGVLRSDDYSSLKPGFWVVFAGEFDSQQEAQRESERYAGLGFPGGYARFVNGGE